MRIARGSNHHPFWQGTTTPIAVVCICFAGLFFDQGATAQDLSPPKAPEIDDIWRQAPSSSVEEDGGQPSEIPSEQDDTIGTISYDLDALPFPTRRMRELILEATQSGDVEKLRPLIGTGDHMTLLSLGEVNEDPIEFLKQQSGDPSGHEILAILEEVIEAGYVHLDAGTDRELFVWPYFYAYPIDQLTDRQTVELFRIITFGDFQDMEEFGGYIFYRVGISPTGRWQFFVAGD